MNKLQIQPLKLSEKYQSSEFEINDAIQKQIYGGDTVYSVPSDVAKVAVATANTIFSQDLIRATLEGDTIQGHVFLNTSSS